MYNPCAKSNDVLCLKLRKLRFNVRKAQQIWTVSVNFFYTFVEQCNTKYEYVHVITREDQKQLQDRKENKFLIVRNIVDVH